VGILAFCVGEKGKVHLLFEDHAQIRRVREEERERFKGEMAQGTRFERKVENVSKRFSYEARG
jgi:hypothetical protein